MKLKDMWFDVQSFGDYSELVKWVNAQPEILIKSVVEKQGLWYVFFYKDKIFK